MSDEFFDGLDDEMVKQAEDEARERDAATWSPEKSGDMVKGIFLKASFVADKYNAGQFKPVIVIKDIDTGESIKVWGSRTALRNQLVENHPAPGSKIGIRYGGFTETPDGDYDGYHSYTVVLPERTEEQAKKGFEYWQQARAEAKEASSQPRTPRATRGDEAPF